MDDKYQKALADARVEIDKIDTEILRQLSKRWKIVKDVYKIKKANNLPIKQNGRYQTMMNELSKKADELGVDQEVMHAIWESIHAQSIKTQEKMEQDNQAERNR